MLTPDEVVATVRELWRRHQLELPDHDRVRGYVRGKLGTPEVPEGAGDELQDIAKLAVMNVLGMVRDEFSDPLSVEGFRSAGEETNAKVWELWQSDRMDARQSEVYKPAVTYGTSYAVALKDQTKIRSPRQMLAVYADPSVDLWPVFALEHWIDNSGVKPARKGMLYDDGYMYPVDLGNAGIRVRRVDGEERSSLAVRIAYDEDDAVAHGAEVCPVVRFVNARDTEDVVVGEVEPLIRDQKALNVVNFDRLVVSRYGAFPQKYAIGWAAADANELQRTSVARLMAFDDENIKVGSFPAANVEGYNSILKDMKVHIAKTAKVSVGAVMDKAENVGADTIAALDASYQDKLGAKRRSFGESWEQYLTLKAALNGIDVPEDGEVIWDTTEARSYSQVVDGISKLTAADPSLLSELLQDIPGWNQQRVDAARAALRRGAGRKILEQLRGGAPEDDGSGGAPAA